MKRQSRTWVALIAALAILVSACGASGDKKDTATTKADNTTTTAETTTTTSTSTSETSSSVPDTTEPESSTSTPSSSGDEARASAANIVASDLPTGWTGKTHAEGTSKLFATCAPEIKLEVNTKAQSASSDFSRVSAGSQSQVNSVTRILASETVAKDVMAKLADAAFIKCIETALKGQGFKPGTATGSLSGQALTGLGDEAAGIGGKISGVDASNNQQATLGVSIVAVRTGDLVTVLTGVAVGSTQPGDDQLLLNLAKAVASRQKA